MCNKFYVNVKSLFLGDVFIVLSLSLFLSIYLSLSASVL